MRCDRTTWLRTRSCWRLVRCTEEQARDLLEYFDRAAAALEVRGDYERSTSCAQAAELIRRTLDGRVIT